MHFELVCQSLILAGSPRVRCDSGPVNNQMDTPQLARRGSEAVFPAHLPEPESGWLFHSRTAATRRLQEAAQDIRWLLLYSQFSYAC